jgi:hypothetical protein
VTSYNMMRNEISIETERSLEYAVCEHRTENKSQRIVMLSYFHVVEFRYLEECYSISVYCDN